MQKIIPVMALPYAKLLNLVLIDINLIPVTFDFAEHKICQLHLSERSTFKPIQNVVSYAARFVEVTYFNDMAFIM